MEKEFDDEFPCLMHFLPNKKSWGYSEVGDDVKSFMNKSIRTLLESFGEEIVGRDRDEVIGNETYINTIIENQLRAEQRLKMKEIISSIGK